MLKGIKVISISIGSSPLGGILGCIVEKKILKNCNCDVCKCKQAEAETRFEVVNDVVMFVVKGEHHDEIEELIKTQNTIDLFDDQATWIEICSGGSSAFHRLSDSSKETLERIKEGFITELEGREDPPREVLHICNNLQSDNGECVNIIKLLNRKDVEDEKINDEISSLRKMLLEMKFDEEDIAKMRTQVKELKVIIPESLQNLTEPPAVMMPADELHDMIKDRVPSGAG